MYADNGETALTIHDFLDKKFKGSRKFRVIFSESESVIRKLNAKTPITNFFRIAGP
jgi:hypothetical protein